jgi:hypothetical protein
MGNDYFKALIFERLNDGDIDMTSDEIEEYEPEVPNANLVDWAAASGRLIYLCYLTVNTDEVGTTHAMDSAAYYGNFNIVQYPYQHKFYRIAV